MSSSVSGQIEISKQKRPVKHIYLRMSYTKDHGPKKVTHILILQVGVSSYIDVKQEKISIHHKIVYLSTKKNYVNK